MKHELIGKRIKGITRHGEEYEAVVVDLDYERGITIDTLEPEKLEALGYRMSEDNHTYCLNAGRGQKNYKEEFISAIEQIRSGTYDARLNEKLFSPLIAGEPSGHSMNSCAFD